MQVGASTRTGVSIAIARDPSLVRTVRLVAAAVARRAVADELVEEVRLAVGEACAVMVGALAGRAAAASAASSTPVSLNGSSPPDRIAEDHVRVQLDVGPRLSVTVSCRPAGDPADASYDGNRVDPWALLRGLTEDLAVSSTNGTLTVSMSWPGQPAVSTSR